MAGEKRVNDLSLPTRLARLLRYGVVGSICGFLGGNMQKIKNPFAATVCAIILACWYRQAPGAESRPIDGIGTSSCGEYSEYILDENASKAFVSWTQGFLSGMNLADRSANKKFVLLPDELSIRTHLDIFCRDNPLATPFEGSILLYKKLRRNQ